MSMTLDEAIQQATQLRNQGLPFPKIVSHLKKAGYVSPYTRKAIGEQTVRHMVDPKKRPAKKEPDKIMEVSSPKGELLEAIGALSALPGIDVATRLKLITHLLQTTETI